MNRLKGTVVKPIHVLQSNMKINLEVGGSTMVRCENCDAEFSWRKIFIANWLYKTVQCENCGKSSKITYGSRGIVTCLTVMPLLVFGLILSPFENIFVTFLIAITIAVVCSLFTPFLVRYKPVEQATS